MEELIADPFRAARLVLRLRQEGVTDDAVLKAMETIDRGAFVEGEELKKLAFDDCVLPIPCGQTIPRPAVTGQLLQAMGLGPSRLARILLVGMGSGYTAALAGQLGSDVFAVERYDRLTEAARQRIVRLGLGNVAVRHGDGMLGWAERGPYDRIVLTGQVDEVPDTLLSQLGKDGLLLAPMLHQGRQQIARMNADRKTEWIGLSFPLPPLAEGKSRVL